MATFKEAAAAITSDNILTIEICVHGGRVYVTRAVDTESTVYWLVKRKPDDTGLSYVLSWHRAQRDAIDALRRQAAHHYAAIIHLEG